jgi:hypothetical protein
VDRLAQLKAGSSSRSDVLQALGEPQGTGAARMPNLPLQEVLLYESDTFEGTKTHLRMLIVYVTKSSGVYDGYMWFDSGMLLGREK